MKIKLSLRVFYLCLLGKRNELRLSNERSGRGGVILELNELRLSNERSGRGGVFLELNELRLSNERSGKKRTIS